MKHEEKIKVEDSKGFHYEVKIDHNPQFGFSNALYEERIIAQTNLSRLIYPASDDDREWEMYEERFSEWKDEVLINLIPECKQYFDNRN